jgi:flavin-binding protein dodecin
LVPPSQVSPVARIVASMASRGADLTNLNALIEPARMLLGWVQGVSKMSVAKVIEVTSTPTKSFEDAIQTGIARASKTLDNVEGAWIKEQKVQIKDGKITGYRVNMMVTFVISD